MIIFFVTIAIGMFLVYQTIVAYKKSGSLAWLEIMRGVVGLLWAFTATHTLFIMDKVRLYECYFFNNQLIWPVAVLSLAVMVASGTVWSKKVEGQNGGGNL